MKRLGVFVLCALFLIIPMSVEAKENVFRDVKEEAYYYDAMLWNAKNGIVYGIADRTFGVEASCTRGQGITFLWRAEGELEAKGENNLFLDVHNADYYYDAVQWGLEKGIVAGTSGNSFSPDIVLTRGQFVSFLYRMMGGVASSRDNPFQDVSADAYYYDAMLWAVEKGIAAGITETTFAPDMPCLRVQVVSFLYRAYQGELEEEVVKDIVVSEEDEVINAAKYGPSPDNFGTKNSKVLQKLVDKAAQQRRTIYIPSGDYKFAANGVQTIGTHCIKLKSNIKIIGDGEATVLRPVGKSNGGLDMFYFNEYVDTGEEIYLENCTFENFMIDGEDTSCIQYTSAGKGFMINLFKNCNWKNVTVKNTDATGFGVDCPLGGKIEECVAINCGKAAQVSNSGASGFGIGFGYSEKECFEIRNCQAYDNKNFGFFFEHQKRFNRTRYQAEKAEEFVIYDCIAEGNNYNFGGLLTMDTIYEKCKSIRARMNGFYFENSKDCLVRDCISIGDNNVSFAILRSLRDGGDQIVKNITFEKCRSEEAVTGTCIENKGTAYDMENIRIEACIFEAEEETIVVRGSLNSLILIGNVSQLNNNLFASEIIELTNEGNSWN